jgi:hypothetical protein
MLRIGNPLNGPGTKPARHEMPLLRTPPCRLKPTANCITDAHEGNGIQHDKDVRRADQIAGYTNKAAVESRGVSPNIIY